MTIKGLREAAVERAARIIDPTSFKAWEGTFNYGVTNGETLDDARATADHFHKKAKDEARDKAREILASDPPPFRGEVLTSEGGWLLENITAWPGGATHWYALLDKPYRTPRTRQYIRSTYTSDPNKALRFGSREEAEQYRDGRLEAWERAALVATEHEWPTHSPALVTPGEEDSSPSRDLGQAVGVALDISAERICEIMADGDGFWRSCSGCLELEDGQNVHGYPHSKTLGCVLGGGCRECGGLGAIWDTTDYAAMADWIGVDLSSAKPALGDSSRDAPETAVTPGVREALEEARDLLMERRYGNPARSPGHNARLCVEEALAALTAPVGEKP